MSLSVGTDKQLLINQLRKEIISVLLVSVFHIKFM